MATNTRMTNLGDYKFVLPYASEKFGVYQPMIGWKSKRTLIRLKNGVLDIQNSLVHDYLDNFTGKSHFISGQCNAEISMEIGILEPIKLLKNNGALLKRIAVFLPKDKYPKDEEWGEIITKEKLEALLHSPVNEGDGEQVPSVQDFYKNLYDQQCNEIVSSNQNRKLILNQRATFEQGKRLESEIRRLINQESALAGALLEMVNQKMFLILKTLFYKTSMDEINTVNLQIADLLQNNNDPFAIFDPKKDIENVSLSPLGIVHLFRQYFFELDTFLGTPTGHVWLSPGSSVELIEVSTRRVYTEKTIEQSTETTKKTETSTTDEDEFSEAVKKDNKNDLKLGASLTVNQSWGTGNATAVGTLNMEKTQEIAREDTQKRMHEQSKKLSTEIKQNYKSTFKTITESTDTSSKRYVLNNTTKELINYELRRKMRQVGVQVQDIGTYLCWETFVDEPGKNLGLANLVHIAKPADLVSVPSADKILPPDDTKMCFTTQITFNQGKIPAVNGPDGFHPVQSRELGKDLPDIPEGFSIVPNSIKLKQLSGTGTDFKYIEFAWMSTIVGKTINFGIYIAQGEYNWDNQIDFEIGVEMDLTTSSEKRKEIADANTKNSLDHDAATAENDRKTKGAFLTAAKERIEFASEINIRKYEDLREEERIIVYRNLIGTLMYESYDSTLKIEKTDPQRHILSELINSIFDVDKMLYFVAPEWWKPRKHYHQTLGIFNDSKDNFNNFDGSLTNWSDLETRADNYYITEKSQYSKMGSSLGWLLQLDGDDLRNAFLNAPWVKAVLPIRPGKELEATNWLQQVGVEGADGLDAAYKNSTTEELDKIRAALGIAINDDVTIGDAVKYLCAEVALKHKESTELKAYTYKDGNEKAMVFNDALINDDNVVSAIPIDKVYEHGFYPLKGGFRASIPGNFKVFSQWVEVLPTDQVVPVEVKYDPKTGLQI